MEVQWLGLSASTEEGPGSSPGWATNIRQVAWHGQKKSNKRTKSNSFALQNEFLSLCCLL